MKDHIQQAREERRAIFQYNGAIFGYPQCCIDDFCDRDSRMRTAAQMMVAGHHGFIPCPTHAKQIQDGEITIESLITNRYPDIPAYPNG